MISDPLPVQRCNPFHFSPLVAQDEDSNIHDLCSTGCVWLNVSDGTEAVKLLEMLLNIKDIVVLDDTSFMHSCCAVCKISLAVIAYKVYKQAQTLWPLQFYAVASPFACVTQSLKTKISLF